MSQRILLVEDTSREIVNQMMKMNEYIDVLIPRGGAGLIKTVVEKSTVPVIETGTGNCHVYVDESADIDMAVNIIELCVLLYFYWHFNKILLLYL